MGHGFESSKLLFKLDCNLDSLSTIIGCVLIKNEIMLSAVLRKKSCFRIPRHLLEALSPFSGESTVPLITEESIEFSYCICEVTLDIAKFHRWILLFVSPKRLFIRYATQFWRFSDPVTPSITPPYPKAYALT